MRRSNNKIVPPLVLALAAFGALGIGMTSMSGQLMIASLAIAVAFSFQLDQSKTTDFLSGVAFGMYLVHPAIIAVALYVLPATSLFLFPAVTLVALAATLVLKKILPASV